MRHSLLTLAAAAACAPCLMAQHAATPSVDILPLPNGISSVIPAQGFIDISPNANPLGVGEITVRFPSIPELNRNCTADVKCWYNDGAEPIATANVTNAAVDMMGNPTSSILFGKNLTAAGTYHVEVPAGFWTVDGMSTPAFALNYEIFTLYELSPAAGVVDDFSEITLVFPGADEVVRTSAAVEFYNMDTDDNYTLMFHNEASVPGGPNNKIVMTFANEAGTPVPVLTQPGTYNFHCVADAFTVKKYGPNYASDPTDYTVWHTPEIVRHYQVPNFPAPSISPEQGEVTSFEKFTLTMPEDFQLFIVDNMTTSYIYPLMPDGSMGTDALCRLKATRNFDVENEVYLTVTDARGVAIEGGIKPEPGQYVLVLANALLSGMYDGQFINSVSYRYVYTVKSDIPDSVEGVIISEPVCVGVYTLDGKKIADSPEALPAGIYVVDGKKVLVK